jgi:hypothetical protein
MNPSAMVHLPGGLWQDGVCHRQAGLRPLDGNDEAFLLESASSLSTAERTSALLARCLTRLGDLSLADQEPLAVARALTVGDREALLLHLRRLTEGERLQCVLQCPDPGCGEKMDLELRVSDLLLPPYAEPRGEYETTVGDNGGQRRVRFRLPTGADQEAIAPLAAADPDGAAALLLRRCVLEVDPAAQEGLPAEVQAELPAVLSELDPQAELLLDMQCPACGQPFTALLDAASYFYREIANRSAHLYRQVHLLAFYYHWSEAEIMGMTTAKRQRYLDLLVEALGEAGSP